MKVLVTGHKGFVGSLLFQELKKQGHEVYGLDQNCREKNEYQADLRNSKEIAEVLKNIAPEIIFHLAGISRVDFETPDLIYEINFNGTLNLLSASLALKKRPVFIFISSSQVYGVVPEAKQPINEECEVKPVNHYGSSKASAEHAVLAYHLDFDLPVVISRSFSHTGKGQTTHFVLPKLVEAFRKKDKIIKLGNLQVIRDFLDVRDVIDAYIGLMKNYQKVNGEIFNVCSGKEVLILELFESLKKETGHKMEIEKVQTLIRKNEILHVVGDNSKIFNKIGWQPKYEIHETLKWMLAD